MRALAAATAAGSLLGLAPLDGAVGVGLRLIGCALLGYAVTGRPGADAGRGLWVGLLWYGTSLLWFPLTWARFDSVGDPWLAYVGLILLQATIPAVTLGLAGALRARRVPAPVAFGLALPAAGGLAEVVQPLPAGLPVYLAGDAALLLPAALGGPALLLAALGAWIGVGDRPRIAVLALLVWLVAGAAQPWADDGAPIAVGLVQPNTGPLDGRRASTAERREDALIDAILAAGDRGAALVATPEGAWPDAIGPDGASRTRRMLARLADAPPTLLGVNRRDGPLPTNAVVAVSDGAIVGRYEKRALLPLGERALFGFGRDVYAPGAPLPDPEIAGARVAVRICYEDLLTSRLAGLGAATLLVTPSNDGWLGPGAGSGAHENASRLAAAITGRWTVRATTNGRSAVFDPTGRRRAHLPWVEGDTDPPPAPTIAVLPEVRLRRPAWAGADVSPWLTAAAALAALALLVGRRALPSPASPPGPEPA